MTKKLEMKYSAYVKDGNKYIPCPTTVDSLPAGMYSIQSGFFGASFHPYAFTGDDLMDVKGSPSEALYADLLKFMEKREQYERAGLAHKRGYLLHGPPGTGKTSIAMLLAQRVVRDGGLVFITPTAGHLQIGCSTMKSGERDRVILYILEEVDQMHEGQLLPLLDGQESSANSVFVATTNYLDNLAPRIRNRPGRFDVVLSVAQPPTEVRREYITGLLDKMGASPEILETVTAATEGMSLAHLREIVVAHVLMDQPLEDVTARVREMVDAPKKKTQPTKAGLFRQLTGGDYVPEDYSPAQDQANDILDS